MSFTVDAAPVPKGRARAFVRPGKKGGRGSVGTYTPEATKMYEDTVRIYFMRALQELRVDFEEEWPVEPADYELQVDVYRLKNTGDLDNYVKAVSDALNGLAWPDDRYVFSLRARMLLDRVHPRTMVVIRRWPLGTFTDT